MIDHLDRNGKLNHNVWRVVCHNCVLRLALYNVRTSALELRWSSECRGNHLSLFLAEAETLADKDKKGGEGYDSEPTPLVSRLLSQVIRKLRNISIWESSIKIHALWYKMESPVGKERFS